MSRIGREQRVQRIQADECGAFGSASLHDFAQVGEIADAPVGARAQRIELYGEPPETTPPGEHVGFVAAARRGNQYALGRRAVGGPDRE
jgi:hypothetical protein